MSAEGGKYDFGICPWCEGDGGYSKLADCTTFDGQCACNGPRVIVEPCDLCEGSGRAPEAVERCVNASFLHHCATGDDLDCVCGAHEKFGLPTHRQIAHEPGDFS